MPIAGELLEILCCPVSKIPLQLLSTERLNKLNAAIRANEALFVDGSKVAKPLEEALVTSDMKVIYPVEDSIPILLEERGIGTAQFTDF
jgi:uncharacterized protein YbaR (Trm112 family)